MNERCVSVTLLGLFLSAGLLAQGSNFDPEVRRLVETLRAPASGRLECDAPAEAAVKLAGMGDSVVPALLEALKSDAADARRLVAWALGNIGDPASAAALAALLGDEDGFVRDAAETALLRIGRAAAESVAEMIEAEPADTRLRASRLLGRIGDAGFGPLLSGRISDSEPAVRRTAVEALGRIGFTEPGPRLIRLLGDEDQEVRRRTVWALQRIWPPGRIAEELEENGAFLSDRLRSGEESVRRDAAEILALLGEPAAPLAVRVLITGELAARRHAAQTLWRMQPTSGRVVAPLLTALGDEDAEVRGYAAGALGSPRDRRALPPLLTALQDRESRVRASAADSLGKLRMEEAIPGLAPQIQDPHADVRLAAVRALSSLGPDAVDALIPALRDADRAVRDAAAVSLGTLGDPRATDALAAALDHALADPDLQAGSGLQRVPARQSRFPLITALGQMRDHSAAVEALIRVLEQTPIRDAGTLHALNRALENATGAQVFVGIPRSGHEATEQQYNRIMRGWRTWLESNVSRED